MHYFAGTAQEALDEWLRVKDDLIAGRTPRAAGDGLTVAALCNRFLTAKAQLRDNGEITARHWGNYKATTDRLIGHFGKTRFVSDLAADDFEGLRAQMAKTLGPVSLGNAIQHVRIVFKYADDSGLIERPVRYGPMFKRPSKKVLRLARTAKGPRLFEAEHVAKFITGADLQLRAMVFLAINCGFGNADVGTLPLSALDLDAGWVNYPRPKTGVERRCKLWPETVEALKAAIVERPKPNDAGDERLVFVTKYGAAWAKDTTDNPITKEFRKLLDDLGLHKAGLGFYSLRHTFRTVADESRDQPACNAIMGHSDGSMAESYRERIGDERLVAVSSYVHAWLFPESAKDGKGTKAGKVMAAKKPPKEKPAPARRPVSARADDSPRLRIVG